jgi:hypothetical protein
MPNWGILQPVDVGGAFNQGMQMGVQFRREKAMDDAYRGLAQDPNNPNVVNALLRDAPDMAYKISQQQQQAQQQARQAEVRMGAVRGDAQALEQLAGIDLNEYRQLRDDQKQAAKQGLETIGQLALMADTPEEWDEIVGKLAQADPSFAKYQGRFDMRESVIAQTGQAVELLKQQEPRYQVVPEGGMLVNTKDPAALQQAAQQAQATLPPGFVLDQGGPTQPASAPFQR